jgi:hypothetical protein
MKYTTQEQYKLFNQGKALKSLKDGVIKKILPGDPRRGINSCLGFINPGGSSFYGAGPFSEDEELELVEGL